MGEGELRYIFVLAWPTYRGWYHSVLLGNYLNDLLQILLIFFRFVSFLFCKAYKRVGSQVHSSDVGRGVIGVADITNLMVHYIFI
jgi:hypothetical protein